MYLRFRTEYPRHSKEMRISAARFSMVYLQCLFLFLAYMVIAPWSQEFVSIFLFGAEPLRFSSAIFRATVDVRMQCPRGCGNIIAVVDALQNIFIRQFNRAANTFALHLIALHIKQVEFMEASALHRLLSVQEMMPARVQHNGAHRRVQVAPIKIIGFRIMTVCTLLLYKTAAAGS